MIAIYEADLEIMNKYVQETYENTFNGCGFDAGLEIFLGERPWPQLVSLEIWLPCGLIAVTMLWWGIFNRELVRVHIKAMQM